jgi:CBS domain containing-hemolysin-like protein
MLAYVLAIILLLACSAFFSGSETALFSLTPGQRERLRAERPRSSRRIESLLHDSDRLLGTLLLGNLIVNTIVTALATLVLLAIVRRTGGSEGLVISIGGLAVTALLLVCGEITPKVVATRIPVQLALLAAPVLPAVQVVLRPVVALVAAAVRRILPRKPETEELTDDELHTMVELGRRQGVLQGSEDEVLLNLIDLDRRAVSEVMTPRIDIVAVPESATIAEAIATCRRAGFSRLPVYRDTVDRVTGTIHIKELLAVTDERAPVSAIARPPWFVPEVKSLPELLDELRRRGSHIAIVVDEFGQTAGLVTLEDLLEAVFGEITDEYDVAEELPYSKVEEGCYLVDGEIDVATLNRLFQNALRGVASERLSSLIHEKLGRLPASGDHLVLGRVEITVKETDGPKVEKVVISRRERK